MEPKGPNSTENDPDLAFVLHELECLREGVSLLGLKQCSCCRRYFHCPDAKNLLNVGQLVCYRCVESWWQQRSPKLGIEERRNAERQILRWLVAYHGAKVIRDMRHMPAADTIELKVVVGCEQCAGKGSRGAEACSNCDGRGSQWVVVLKSQIR